MNDKLHMNSYSGTKWKGRVADKIEVIQSVIQCGLIYSGIISLRLLTFSSPPISSIPISSTIVCRLLPFSLLSHFVYSHLSTSIITEMIVFKMRANGMGMELKHYIKKTHKIYYSGYAMTNSYIPTTRMKYL